MHVIFAEIGSNVICIPIVVLLNFHDGFGTGCVYSSPRAAAECRTVYANVTYAVNVKSLRARLSFHFIYCVAIVETALVSHI